MKMENQNERGDYRQISSTENVVPNPAEASVEYCNATKPTPGSFILENGTALVGYPKTVPLQEEISSKLKFDTTGKYYQIGSQASEPIAIDREKEEQRQYNHRQFYQNIPLFLANADRILSDSRLFLTEVKVDNGLAYTGVSGLQHPTLGVYLEWWLNHRESSHDRSGYPIWYISGSPLSGCHACASVDADGHVVDAELQGRFKDVWSGFMEVNNRYITAKNRFEAYTLDQAIALLKAN